MQIKHNSNLAFIPCTKEKIWDLFSNIGPQKAFNVYIGPEFIFSMNLAKQYADRIIIFSAKYGFLETEDYIKQTYDITFSRKNDPCISLTKLREQANQKKLFEYKKINTYCGKLYNEKIYKVFQHNYQKEMIINNVESV